MNAPQLPMFYRNVVPLSRERHKGWYIDADHGYSFAAKTNSIYLAASEFALAAREYAIVFARDASGTPIPAILSGLATDQNLVVDAEGAWTGNYVPAYVRRYPFILATADGNSQQFTVCIDEAYSGFNTVKEGEQLVDEAGAHGALLTQSVKFLQDFHQHTLLTVNFCAALDKAALLDSMQADIVLNSGEKFSLSGFSCVTRERLKTLAAEALKQLMDRDYLDLIYLHMHSLANIDRLMQLARTAADAAEAQSRKRPSKD